MDALETGPTQESIGEEKVRETLAWLRGAPWQQTQPVGVGKNIGRTVTTGATRRRWFSETSSFTAALWSRGEAATMHLISESVG